jgi:hypothetical protein
MTNIETEDRRAATGSCGLIRAGICTRGNPRAARTSNAHPVWPLAWTGGHDAIRAPHARPVARGYAACLSLVTPAMQRLSANAEPTCHLTYLPAPARPGESGGTAVWICEHPYPTMRPHGPSADCDDCPVWQKIQAVREAAAAEAAEEVRRFQSLMG